MYRRMVAVLYSRIWFKDGRLRWRKAREDDKIGARMAAMARGIRHTLEDGATNGRVIR